MLLGWARRWLRAGAVGLTCVAMGWASVALAQATRLVPTPPNTQYFTTRTIITTDGTSFEQMVINGPPKPPPGYPIESSLAALPAPQPEAGINTITVPAYAWTFGCSATSGAMIAAYYDRNGFPNIYTGPTNGGVMPPDSSVWPQWTGPGPGSSVRPMPAGGLPQWAGREGDTRLDRRLLGRVPAAPRTTRTSRTVGRSTPGATRSATT